MHIPDGQKAIHSSIRHEDLCHGLCDPVNDYAQSAPSTELTFVRMDSQYKDWYKKRSGIDLECKVYVLPFQYALQGHPESGTLWANEIEGHFKDLGCVSTTHETCLYHGFTRFTRSFCSR